MPSSKRSASRTICPPSKRRPVSVSINRTTTGVSSSSSNDANISRRPASSNRNDNTLRQEFMDLLAKPQYQQSGISNSQLKASFPGDRYVQLVPIINALTQEARLIMSKTGDELVYKLVNEETASKFAGLDIEARMVYQIIEESGNKGIWTKDIRIKSKNTQQALNKIFKNLESRKLIKPVKAVNAKAKKCYMLYDVQPSKEITGGPWYTEMEFDHEFISELRTFIMHCVRRLNGGKGVTLKEIAEKMKTANVSRVQLSLQEVQQLMQTLAFDYMIEPSGVNQNEEPLFIAAKRLTVPCNFNWWEVICPDFHFRNIRFEDDVLLTAHEPHYHTAS